MSRPGTLRVAHVAEDMARIAGGVPAVVRQLSERLSLMKPADKLITVTLQEGYLEPMTIIHGLKMLPPRFLYPEKPATNSANLLGHRVGVLGADDATTQVSFGIIAESFAAYGWMGILFIPFLACGVFFSVYRLLGQDLALNPMGLVASTPVPARFCREYSQQHVAQLPTVAFCSAGVLWLFMCISVAREKWFQSLGQ